MEQGTKRPNLKTLNDRPLVGKVTLASCIAQYCYYMMEGMPTNVPDVSRMYEATIGFQMSFLSDSSLHVWKNQEAVFQPACTTSTQ